MRLATPALALALALPAAAGNLTGRFVRPGLGPVANGTLLMTLSQAGVLPGSYAVVGATASCYTSTDGSVVGVPNPEGTPTGAAFAGAGTLPAGTYYVKVAYTAAGGAYSLPSPEAAFTLSAAGQIQISAPALQPAAATGYAVYIGTAPGAETLQGSVTGFAAFTQAAGLAAGAAPPAANSSVCAVVFNDAIIPSYTYYAAALSDAQGNVVAGFPQNWYLAGASADVSQLEPLASNPAVRFPMPVLANPPVATNQSLASGLNLNGYDLVQSGNVGPGFFSGFWAGAAPAPGTVLATWTPNVGIVVRRLDINAQSAGSGGSAGATVTISDGTSTCTFAGLLPAGAASSSNGLPTGMCQFSGGLPLTVTFAGDDHTGAPANLSWNLELTSR